MGDLADMTYEEKIKVIGVVQSMEEETEGMDGHDSTSKM